MLVRLGPALTEDAGANLTSARHLGQTLLHRNADFAAGASRSVAVDQLYNSASGLAGMRELAPQVLQGLRHCWHSGFEVDGLDVDSARIAAMAILSQPPPYSVIPSEVEGPCVLPRVSRERVSEVLRAKADLFDCEEELASEFSPPLKMTRMSVQNDKVRVVLLQPQCVSSPTPCEILLSVTRIKSAPSAVAVPVRSHSRAVTLEEIMTQLNLSGRQPNNTQQKPITKHDDESIKNQTVGALGALAMFAAVIVIASCSRSNKPVAVEQTLKPEAPVSAPAITTPAVTTPPPAVAKKKTRRAATLSYVNREYGLSFSFPRNYRLNTQFKSGAEIAAQVNFVQPGGISLAAIELPGNLYPGTDFKSGTVNVSVNPGMTSEACAQFAVPEPGTGTETAAKTDQVKLGAIEFHEVQTSDRAMMKEADAKYYHVFGNGACYEFALGVGTDSGHNVEEITPVDRKEVFGRLERILTTVKLRPAVVPETRMTEAQSPEAQDLTAQTPAPAAAVTTPARSTTTPENTSAHSPEKNPEATREKGAPVPNF